MKHFVVFIISLLAIACNSTDAQINCNDIIDNKTQEFIKGNHSFEETMVWVENSYSVSNDTIRVYTFSPSSSIEWEFQGKNYIAYFQNDDLVSITTEWNNIDTKSRDSFKCIGEPEFYDAIYNIGEVGHLSFSVWYPNQNIVVSTAHFGNLNNIVLDETLAMETITFVHDNLRESIQKGRPIIVRTIVSTRHLKPWVDTWNEIKIDEER